MWACHSLWQQPLRNCELQSPHRASASEVQAVTNSSLNIQRHEGCQEERAVVASAVVVARGAVAADSERTFQPLYTARVDCFW